MDDYDVYLVMLGIVEPKSLNLNFKLKRRINRIIARTDLRPDVLKKLDEEGIKYKEYLVKEKDGFYTSRGCYKTRFKKIS